MDADVKEIIENLAKQLGTTSKFLFDKMVKEAKINAITTSIQLLIGVIAGIVLAFYINWQIQLGLKYYANIDMYLGIYVILGFADLIVSLAYIFTFYSMLLDGIDEIIQCWKNPEGEAISKLLSKF